MRDTWRTGDSTSEAVSLTRTPFFPLTSLSSHLFHLPAPPVRLGVYIVERAEIVEIVEIVEMVEIVVVVVSSS